MLSIYIKKLKGVSTRFHNNLVKARRERMRKNLDPNINSDKTYIVIAAYITVVSR
jgi:hypothetical protein